MTTDLINYIHKKGTHIHRLPTHTQGLAPLQSESADEAGERERNALSVFFFLVSSISQFICLINII